MKIKFDVDELNRLMRNRRSIYPQLFTDEKIEDAIVWQILENANWAPTHGLTEPWRFTVFTGEGLKTLADFQSQLYKELTPEEYFKESTFKKLAEKPLQCSHVISIGMKRQESGKIPEIEEIEATACAVENMYLTAAAYGIGAYWGSGGVTYKKEANHFFGLSEQDMLLGFFFMGYPKIEWPEGKRHPVKEKVRWIE